MSGKFQWQFYKDRPKRPEKHRAYRNEHHLHFGDRLNRPLEIVERRARTPRRAFPVSRGQQIADVLRGEGTRCQWQARQCQQCGTHGESNRRASCRASCQLACHVTCGAGREDVGWLHHED